MIDVILCGQWFVLFCLLPLLLFQALGDPESSDTAAYLRVRGPLEFKCQLDSTDGWFKNALFIHNRNQYGFVRFFILLFLYSYRSFIPWRLNGRWQLWRKESWVGLLVMMGLSLWHYKCRPSPTPLIWFSVVEVPSEVYMQFLCLDVQSEDVFCTPLS